MVSSVAVESQPTRRQAAAKVIHMSPELSTGLYRRLIRTLLTRLGVIPRTLLTTLIA